MKLQRLSNDSTVVFGISEQKDIINKLIDNINLLDARLRDQDYTIDSLRIQVRDLVNSTLKVLEKYE